VRQGRINAVAPGRLVHIVDKSTQRRFLVDTGAGYSIFPFSSSGKQSGPRLTGADGLHIPCWGERRLSLVFHGRRFEWPFLLARVQFPIIGVDFLRHFKLLVDPAVSRLVDTVSTQLLPTVSSVRSQPAETSAMAAATPAGRAAQAPVHAQGSAPAPHPGCSQSDKPDRAVTAVAADQPPGRPRFIALSPGSAGSVILDEFPDVANAAKVLSPSSHGVEHFIATKGPPIASKFRRLVTEKLQAAKAEFEQLEREGIVQRSTSPWASPLHMVMKKDGTWRPCGDFRRLNLVTEPDTYPLPNMLDFSARVTGCKVFSKIDLRKGYYQIPMHPADIRKTAICTPFRLFEFRRMPFGLRNAGNTFQRMMDRILAGLSFVFCYLGDIIITSRDEQEHL
jgi:hypothetical protein